MTVFHGHVALSAGREPARRMDARMGQSLARVSGDTGDHDHNISADAASTLSGKTSIVPLDIVTLDVAPADRGIP